MRPIDVLFTWEPTTGLDIIEREAPGVTVRSTRDRAEMLRLIPDAHVLCVGDLDAQLLDAARQTEWVQALMGGVESVLFPELCRSAIPLTCCKECFAIPAAEHALAMMLAFARKLEYDIRRRAQRTFEYQDPEEIHGRTVGIIGIGNIGREIARRCRCFGMRVIGLARSRHGAQDPDFDEIFPREQLCDLLHQSDFAVVAVPLTPETRGLIGATELRSMKPDSYLIDVSGRLAIYDMEALELALRQDQIAGVALQYVPPPASTLWELDNLLLSLHRSTSIQEVERCFGLFADNLNRFRRGEPLRGLVDKVSGY